MKVVRIIIGSCCILFGVIGVLSEIDNYSQQGAIDTFGLFLGVLFIVIGLMLCFWQRIACFIKKLKSSGTRLSFAAKKKQPIAAKVSSQEEVFQQEKSGGKTRPGHASFLIIAGIIELAVGIIGVVFVFILGYHGFVAKEMGTMIGFFSIISLLFVVPYIVLKVIMVYGLFKQKRWGVVVSICFSALYLFGGSLISSAGIFFSLLFLLYGGVTLWAGIKCLKHSYYRSL